ncbi:hypothetical protein HK105_206540 [Polyrhizophydium stewartii]|uniref:Uncharacterized protein n=1 Tax=Polyrhizophydium stewartii TaxID=2732419 RepID=A0ABR4N381_9FUNG
MALDGQLIVYLVPRPGTRLAERLAEFSAASAGECPNEAHLYPPHVSLTGFFAAAGASGADAVADELDAGADAHVHAGAQQAAVRGPLVAKNNAVVLLPVDHTAPLLEWLRACRTRLVARGVVFDGDAAAVSATATPPAGPFETSAGRSDAGMRIKRGDHLSLAYLGHHLRLPGRDGAMLGLSPDQIQRLHKLAVAMITDDDTRDARWDVVLLRMDRQSMHLGVPHAFTELRRWSLGA